MDYKINLFNTLEINQEQFHFQGVTGDQLGIEQQIKDIKKTPLLHPLPKLILFLPISVTYSGLRGHDFDIQSLRIIKITMMVIKAPRNSYCYNTKLRTVLSLFLYV